LLLNTLTIDVSDILREFFEMLWPS
jgi:hypothetical protein